MEKNTIPDTSELFYKVVILSPYEKGYIDALERHCDFMMPTKTGVNFGVLKINNINGQTINLQIWDFHSEILDTKSMPFYLSGTHGVLLMVDKNDSEALSKTRMNIDEIIRYQGKLVLGLVSESKFPEKNAISTDEINQFCKENDIGIVYHLSSENDSLTAVFEKIAVKITESL